MSWNKTSMEFSFDIPDTPENKEAIEALIKQSEEAGRKEVERIEQMLSDACEEEAMKWTVDNPLIDEMCRSTLKKMLLSGAVIGWNICSEYHSKILEESLKQK